MMINSFEFLLSRRYLFPKTRDSFFSIITIFSFLGIALGVATLIIVMSVMNGFREELTSKVLGMNGHFKVTLYNNSKFPNYKSIIESIENKNINIDATIVSQGIISFQKNSTGILIKGLSKESLLNRKIMKDKIISSYIEKFEENDGIILGSKLARKLDIKINDYVNIVSSESVDTPFGKLTRSGDFKVLGFFETGMYEYDVSMIIYPLKLLQDFLNTNDKVDNLEIFINNFESLDNNYKLIREKLPKYFRVYDWRKMNPSLFNAIEIERNVMFLILTLIIIVAAFNLISSMVMLVNNKKKDIGILRSLGLSRNEILRIFIMSGFMIGMIGTILGLIIGIAFCHNINEIKAFLELFTNSSIFAEEIYFFSKLPMIIDYKEVVFIIIVTLILCFCAALYPAYKASNVEPINLIKWE